MKIFVYKALFVFVCIFILFQLTIGMQIKKIKHELEELQSKENIEKGIAKGKRKGIIFFKV